MKIKTRLICFVIIPILFIQCCKETDYPIGYSIVGKWNIIKIDSGLMSSNIVSDFTLLERLPDTGSIVFDKDSTGHFTKPIRNLTGKEMAFSWQHMKYNGILNFSFANGSTYAYIQKQNRDTLDILFWNYSVYWPYTGSGVFYNLLLVK